VQAHEAAAVRQRHRLHGDAVVAAAERAEGELARAAA
jgi:hypothetical protein